MLRLVSLQPLVKLLTLESGPLDDVRQTPGCGLARHSAGRGRVSIRKLCLQLCVVESQTTALNFSHKGRVLKREGSQHPPCNTRGRGSSPPSVAGSLFTDGVC